MNVKTNLQQNVLHQDASFFLASNEPLGPKKSISDPMRTPTVLLTLSSPDIINKKPQETNIAPLYPILGFH